MRKKKVFVIGVGGAVAAKSVNGTWKSGELTQKDVTRLAPELEKTFDIEETNFLRVDSTNVQPENWLTLAQTIYYKLKDFDGVVVTHGTDTMGYTATALSFLIQNLNIPIVFTGSQIIPSLIGTDAKRNFVDAVRVSAMGDIAESIIVFNGKIFRGNRSKKFREVDFNAFESVGMSPLGKIEQEITLAGEQLKRKKRKPKLFNKIDTDVALVKIHPGYSPKRLQLLFKSEPKGVVIEGYGSGNVPTEKRNIIETIKKFTKAEVPVVLTTQCDLGPGGNHIYDVGAKAIEAGVIPGQNILSETALVKLMWILGQTTKMREIKKMMKKNYAGELNGPY